MLKEGKININFIHISVTKWFKKIIFITYYP